MATTTTNFGWDIPQSTDLVKDGATAIAALGQDIDTAMVDLKGGTTGQVLAKATNTDLDFTWVAQDDSNAIQNAIVDAKGDLIAATAADTPARLAVGTNGQVLTADSTAATGLKWETSTSGGMTLLSTTSLTGSTTTVSSISGSYTNLVVYLKDFYAGDAAQVFLNFNTDTTNANYQWSAMRGYASGADFQFAANARCIATTLRNTQADNFMAFEIPNYANTTTHKTYLAYGKVLNSVNTVVNNVLNATYIGGTSAISSISFVTDVGTWQAGTIEIYGVK
jgi:hypothetical protein